MELYMMNRQGRMITESVEMATNIILQGLSPEVYALVSDHKVAKELWERIQLLMQGTSLMKQEMECKLYDEFDKFAYKKEELLLFQKGNDPIYAINHMISFLTAVVTSRYPPTNNQLRNSSNPRQQATINNERVTSQPIQGKHNSLAASTSRTYTSRANGNNSRKQRTVVCYNCKGEGHMSKQCTKPKMKRDESWFKDKEDLVLKFINQFFPPSKTTYLQNEIINFLQKPNETFNEAWEHFKDLLRQCPHHGFSELHQLDTFYNALNLDDQDALYSVVGGNFLDKIPRECLAIIESNSKVRYSRSRVIDSRVSINAPLPSSSPSHSFDLQQIVASLEDKLDIRMNRFEKYLNDMKAFVTPTASIKAVEEICVTCGSNDGYNHCPLTRGGNEFPIFHDNIQQF
nr:hypothetical protein [Tanacetum cinerariifolium]